MRKWTKSACLVIAWGILSLLVVAVSRESGHPAPANLSIAGSTGKQAVSAGQPATLLSVTAASATPAAAPATWVVRPGDTLTAIAAGLAVPGGWKALYAANRRILGPDPSAIRPGTRLTLTGQADPVRYAVAPGDSLSGIAAALSVRGGWRALYAANRKVIGPDPDIIRPGTILVAPAPATRGAAPAPAAPGAAPARAPHAARGAGRHEAPGPRGPSVSGTPAGGVKAAAAVMPRWLKDTLLAAGLLTLIAFTVEPVAVVSRRRRRARTSPPDGPSAARVPGPRVPEEPAAGQPAVEKATRVIEASHERLIVTYSVRDDTVYLLTPPGEDPRAVLRAARLVLPEDTYEELAGHLGVPSGWRE